MKRSWKTTAAGVAAIVIAICGAIDAERDGNPDTRADWGAVVALIAAGAIGIFSRDNNVTSKQAGAEP